MAAGSHLINLNDTGILSMLLTFPVFVRLSAQYPGGSDGKLSGVPKNDAVSSERD